ncbi:MAG: Gfo/Idh/MocA family oxidoreductase [Opitutales bacterium]|nr:Gfo/Idh/MocA family oxidoreductase [Opitutales bacterium]
MKYVAIIGVTGYARVHLDVCLEHHGAGRLRLRAAVVVNPDEAADRVEALRSVGCRIYPDDDSMWAAESGNIDLCIIPVPIALHASMSIKALRAGANVLVEKPLAGTVQEVHAMMEAERETGRFIAVGFQDMYSPEVKAVKAALVEGAVGDIRSIHCFGLWPRPPSYYDRNDWAGQLKVGENWVLDSPVSNAMAHFLNLELFFGAVGFWEMARPAFVEADLYRVKPVANFDTAAIRITTMEGLGILFTVSHACDVRVDPVMRIEGSAGRVEWSHCGPFRLLRDGAQPHETIFPFTDYAEVRTNMMNQVLERLDDPSVCVCTTAMALSHTSVVNALYESARITDVPLEWQKSKEVNGEESLCLKDLPEAIQTAFDEGKLFRELGLPWARGHGRKFNLAGYSHFSGGRLEEAMSAGGMA